MPEESAPNLSQVPAPAPAPAESDDGFAADLLGPPLQGEAAARPEPATAPAFDPDTVDWYRAQPKDLPPWAQKVQRNLKDNLSERSRLEQELRRPPAPIAPAAPEVNADLVRAIEKLAPAQDRYADLRSKLPPEEVGAIDVVLEIMRRELAESGPKVEPVQQEVATLKQAVAYVLRQMQQSQVSTQVGELQAAVGKYGEDALRAAAPTLRGLMNVPNPHTGRLFTLGEAAGWVLGRGQQEQAQERDAQARATAKRSVASVPSAPVNGQGPLSNDQVIAEMRALGFK